ncbi:MAG: hypothetical protein KKG76_05870, partial [Euryarchaeota archaeon]|nr:hypothetical protein [Euryarchaeota archaeon]
MKRFFLREDIQVECRYIPVTEFAAQSNGSIYRKGRKERKAHLHMSLNSEEIIRPGTRITQIRRIFTDPCASVSTVTPVDCVHTYASALAYVGTKSRSVAFGVGVYTYAPQGIRVRGV